MAPEPRPSPPAPPRDPRVPKFPVIFADPSMRQVRENISREDVRDATVVATICFPLGYGLFRYVDPSFARRGMLLAGAIGSVGAVLLALQNAQWRLQGYTPNERDVERYLHAHDDATPSVVPSDGSNIDTPVGTKT